MITINLLPLEHRSKKNAVNVMPYVPLAVLFGILFLLLAGFFFADYLKVKTAYDRISNEWGRVSPQMKELKALENKVEVEMRTEKEFLEKYVLNTQSMALVLQQISEYLPPKAWLTEVKLERMGDGGRLNLQGIVLPMHERTAIEQIEDYMKKLKENLPKGSYTLTTAKQDTEGLKEGTFFSAVFDWGTGKV